MKTKLVLSCFTLLLLLVFSCQKEEIGISKSEPTANISAINALAEIQALIPEKVELSLVDETLIRKKDEDNSFPISTIDLTDCQGQPCYQVIPSQLNQMQRMADQFCRTMKINICCCTKGAEWCYQFSIKPRFTCNEVKGIRQLLPKEGIPTQSN